MLRGYGAVKDTVSAEDYYADVVAGRRTDPTLSMQLGVGFEPRALLKDYLHDPASDNYSALLVLDAAKNLPGASRELARRYVRLHTAVPGPRAKAMLERRAAALPAGLGKATDVVVERAHDALLFDVDGNTFIDFASGIGVTGIGHAPAAVVDAVTAQTQKFLHTCSLVTTYEPMVRLAEVLNELTPGDFAKKTIFANSGAEAVENAVKLARKFTGRPAVICFEGGYHGRTLLTLSLTSKYGLFKSGFGPFAPEIVRLPMPQVYRRPVGMSEDQYVDFAIGQLEQAFVAQVDPSAVAAVIVEPVQGEAGFLPVPARFLQRLRELCTQHGIVMIADEVQCGMGRTGRVFAIEHYGLVPDLVVTAKSLGGGMPIGAVTGRAADHGRGPSGRRRRHLRWQPGGVRGRAGRGRDDPAAGVPGPRAPSRRGHARGDDRLAARLADRRRRARPRADDAGRVRARPGHQVAAVPRGHAADRQTHRRPRRGADARRTLQQRRPPAAAADDARGHAARRPRRLRPGHSQRVGAILGRVGLMGDVVFVNGRIQAEPYAGELATTLLTRDGRVTAVGGDDVATLAPSGARRVDLRGRHVVPGFIDAHAHIWKIGHLLTSMLDLRGVASVEAIVASVAGIRTRRPAGSWILGRGFNEATMAGGRAPTRLDLDRAAPDQPVVLTRTCGHIYAVNSVALQRAGIGRDTAPPVGGQIDRDERGEPTGLLHETAMGLVTRVLPPPSADDYEQMIVAALRHQLSRGITTSSDCGVTPQLLEVYRAIDAGGRLPARVHVMPLRRVDGVPTPVPLPDQHASERLRIDTVKFLADGGLSGATAALSVPYRHADTQGLLRFDRDDLLALCRESHDAGWRIAIHAIGDVAIDQVLDVYERLGPHPKGWAHRLEHFGLPDARQLARAARLGAIAVPQTIFIHSLGRNFREYLPDGFLPRCYPVRAMLDAGVRVALSSDAPVVENDDPLMGMESAITRRDREGWAIAPEQAISRRQALAGYTTGGAVAMGLAGAIGTLTAGASADLAVLSDDLMGVAPDALSTIVVEQTWLAGELAYERA